VILLVRLLNNLIYKQFYRICGSIFKIKPSFFFNMVQFSLLLRVIIVLMHLLTLLLSNRTSQIAHLDSKSSG